MLYVSAMASPTFRDGLFLQICYTAPAKVKPPVLVAIKQAIAGGTTVAGLANRFPAEAATLRALAKLLQMGKVDREQHELRCLGFSWMSSKGHIMCIDVALREPAST